MLIKSLICTVCLAFLSIANISAAKISAQSNYRASAEVSSQEDNIVIPPPGEDYVYERVLIGDQWWIFVYTLDGSFVDAYPDEDL